MKNFTEIFSWVYAAMHAWSGASYKGRVVDKHFIEWHLIAFFLPPIHTPHYPRSYLTSDVLQDMAPPLSAAGSPDKREQLRQISKQSWRVPF